MLSFGSKFYFTVVLVYEIYIVLSKTLYIVLTLSNSAAGNC